jgi:hypothetical protein
MSWTVFAGLCMKAHRDNRVLALNVGPTGDGQWMVIAVETTAEAESGSPEERLGAVFDNHAHQALPPQKSPQLAIALAERYAKWWQRSGATHFDCDCEAIDDGAR